MTHDSIGQQFRLGGSDIGWAASCISGKLQARLVGLLLGVGYHLGGQGRLVHAG